MDAKSVVEFWNSARLHGLDICIDGGWAVDSVIGRQTRPHADLDIALPAVQVPKLLKLLLARGFRPAERPDDWAHNFVLEADSDRVIDVHSYILGEDGRSVGGVPYEAQHLTGEGRILGQSVRCVPPKWLVQFHTGYEVDETDWHDVKLLCEKFNLEIPDVYDTYRR